MGSQFRSRPPPAALALCAVCFAAQVGAAEDASAPEREDAGADLLVTADPRTARIHDLLSDKLDVTVVPQSLFDVPLDDEQALQIEAARVRALLRVLEAEVQAPVASGGALVDAAAAEDASAEAGTAPLDRRYWRARLELDRARLDFYSLPAQQRERLLAAHAERREAARPAESAQRRRARAVTEERERALEAARVARSEGERVIREELARLVGVEQAVLAAQQSFTDTREALAARRVALLGWQSRTREARANESKADVTYEALLRALHTARAELSAALDDLGSPAASVPSLGPDPLIDVAPNVSIEPIKQRRERLQALIDAARDQELALRDERATVAMDEVNALNRDRLALLPHLSAGKRAAVTGFTASGLEQARAEARHVVLVLRYHRHVAVRWLAQLGAREGLVRAHFWAVTRTAVPWLIAALVFGSWRRRTPAMLASAEERVARMDRAERRTSPSVMRKGVQFLRRIQRPFDWFVFYLLTLWLLPKEVHALLEVRLLTVVVGWVLGGALVVSAIDALAGVTASTALRARSDVAQLRLRSLRLVGRVVVAFVLVLLLISRLVGEGTVYNWAAATRWIAIVPVALTLVGWWRDPVFERFARLRRKSRLQHWVLEHRRGWRSFLAALIAATQIVALGAYKRVRVWVAEYAVIRRAHAFLFKRELDRLAETQATTHLRPLSAAAFEALAPDAPARTWAGCPADAQLELLQKHVRDGRGGVIALVGARGAGKTTLLERLSGLVPDAVLVNCRATRALAPGAAPLVLLDDAQALIKPVLGGLARFDDYLALARAHALGSTWVFAIDNVVWPFLRRARDARPLFDHVLELEPWTEEQIAELLTLRSTEVGVTPSFEDLLEKLPATADEIDKQEALLAKRAGYFRVLWDYARGNPGMALEVWRSSLVEDEFGSARVRPLQAPAVARLEALPDSSLFILRAVLQMAPATITDIARATHLTEAQVQNVVHFGQSHGYLLAERGSVRVSWAWRRSVLVLLERRHLLVDQ